MSNKSSAASSLAGIGVEKQGAFEMVRKETFKWAVVCGSSKIQKDFKSVESGNYYFWSDKGLPEMTWKFSLHSSEIYNVESTKEMTFRYDCNVSEGTPPPMYVARVAMLGANDNYSNRDREIHKSDVRNNTYGVFPFPLLRRQVLYHYEADSPMRIPKINDVLAFEITLEFYCPSNNAVGSEDTGDLSWNTTHERAAKTNFIEMLNTGKFSDVKIISSDGEEFFAHRLILNAGSEVFEAMFRNDMAESRSGVVTLDDMSAKAVKFLLHFIYSSELLPFSVDENDEAQNENASIDEVVYLASKYRLTELIKYLDEGMKTFCNAKNALNLLKLCQKYSLERGKEDVFNFLMNGQVDLLKHFVFSAILKD